MKRTIYLIVVLLTVLAVKSQDAAFDALKALIARKAPDISLNSRLIAFNTWSPADAESRKRNKEFNRACDVFGHAKLLGGRRGLVCVAIITEDASNARIGLTSDGATLLIPVTASELSAALPADCGIYNDSGNLVYSNLSVNEVFESVNKLITR